MNNQRLSVILITLSIAAGIFFSTRLYSIPGEQRGLVTFTEGSVRKKQPAEEKWMTAAKDTTVISGDRVRTLDQSRAEIQLRELDVLRMAPRTTINIEKLYEETKERRDRTDIQVEQGDIWALVGSEDSGTDFNVGTPVAGAAITGTIFRMSVGRDSSTELKVYRGEVRLTNAPRRTDLKPQPITPVQPRKVSGPGKVSGPREISLEEWVYVVKGMQRIKVDPEGQVESAGDFSFEDPEEQSEWILWNRERDEMLLKH